MRIHHAACIMQHCIMHHAGRFTGRGGCGAGAHAHAPEVGGGGCRGGGGGQTSTGLAVELTVGGEVGAVGGQPRRALVVDDAAAPQSHVVAQLAPASAVSELFGRVSVRPVETTRLSPPPTALREYYKAAVIGDTVGVKLLRCYSHTSAEPLYIRGQPVITS